MTLGIDAASSDSWTIKSLLRKTNQREGSVLSGGDSISDIKDIYKTSPVFGTLDKILNSIVFDYPEILEWGVFIDGF